MEDLKSNDRVNIIIAFYNDNNIITKENCFFKKNIKIEEYSDVPGLFYTELIKDIKPINYSGYISENEYSFEYSTKSGYLIQFNTGYNAFVYISKKSYFEMKNEFFDELINNCKKEINKLEEELQINKKQIEIFESLKG